jgi:molybdopterin-dependent oxidoreductase alpha subunit
MGIYEKPSTALLDSIAKEFGFEPPRHHGWDVVDSIRAMHDGRAKVFFAMGGNFLSAAPDTEFTAEALRRCRLTVHVSTKLNRSHMIAGRQALILPCLGRTDVDKQSGGEQFVTVEDSMGVVHQSHGGLEPPSPELLSEPAIVVGLARATFGETSPIPWRDFAADYDRIRDRIERVIPGFGDYNKRVRVPGGFYLPNGPRECKFTTPSGKSHFTVHPIPRHDLLPGQLLLMTLRSHDQFNTTIYGLDDRYRGVYGGRRVVFLNPIDIAELGLKAEQWVDLTSHYDDGERVAKRFMVVPYEMPRKSAAAYFPETNVLVPVRHTADGSNQPASKSIVITIAPYVGE